MTVKRKIKSKKTPTKKRRFITHDEAVIDSLKKHPEDARLYLKEALKDKEPRVFLLALQHVIEAFKDNVKALKQITSSRPSFSATISGPSRASLHAKKR
jgi:DNA-binding phage protein